MEVRPLIRGIPWLVAGIASALVISVVVAALWFVAAPTIQSILAPVSDDRCEHFASGEPKRDDPDCVSGGLGGINEVEAWDRAHPAR
ncbi:MAG TPA: hypothetical protein VFX74_07735 [Candidatus Limnocylindria bacterium]|jgi:hypothetical protein|nr:hypothetical protein [Candidatus Limnocylindria bacterium]